MKDELIKELNLPDFTPFEVKITPSQKQYIINGIEIYFPYEI